MRVYFVHPLLFTLKFTIMIIIVFLTLIQVAFGAAIVFGLIKAIDFFSPNKEDSSNNHFLN